MNNLQAELKIFFEDASTGQYSSAYRLAVVPDMTVAEVCEVIAQKHCKTNPERYGLFTVVEGQGTHTVWRLHVGGQWSPKHKVHMHNAKICKVDTFVQNCQLVSVVNLAQVWFDVFTEYDLCLPPSFLYPPFLPHSVSEMGSDERPQEVKKQWTLELSSSHGGAHVNNRQPSTRFMAYRLKI